MEARHSTAGESLRQARQAQGRSLQDVAQATKISGDYLRALEEGNYAALPERPFARSFVRRYAAELGLDASGPLAEFDRAMPQHPEISQALRGPAGARRAVLPFGAVLALLSAAVVLGAAGWFGYALWQSRAASLPSPPAVPSAPALGRQVRLNVSSTPAGARVYLDNRYLGETPIESFPLEARASGQLRVQLGGYTTVTQQVTLDQSRNLTVGLSVAPDKPAASGTAASEQAPSGQAVPAPANSAPATPVAPNAAGSIPPGDGGVTLRFAGRSWVRVTAAGGQVLYEGIPAVGSSKQFPAGVTVRAGVPGAVLASVGAGAPVPLGSGAAPVSRQFP